MYLLSPALAAQPLRPAGRLLLAIAGWASLACPSQGQPATPAPEAPAASPAALSRPVEVTTYAFGANLQIAPKRVTFDKSHLVALVHIQNQGADTTTFDITFVDRVMSPTGQIVTAEDAAADPELQSIAGRLQSAKPVLQVSPRRTTLAKGQDQILRIRFFPSNGPPGEYRSHLTVTAVPPAEFGLTAEAAAAGLQEQLKFRVTSLFSLTIPVIVRTAPPVVAAAIDHVRIEDGSPPNGKVEFMPNVTLDLVRQGTSSLFGNLEVRSLADPDGALLGLARGVGVYPEVPRRTLRLALSRRLAPGEKLLITFTDDDLTPGRRLASYTGR
jgi:hypothetical protein